MTHDRQLYRTYYYNAERDEDINPKAYAAHRTFLSTLNNKPKYVVRLGNSKQRGDTTVEKGVDIMLATDLLKYAWDDLYDIGLENLRVLIYQLSFFNRHIVTDENGEEINKIITEK